MELDLVMGPQNQNLLFLHVKRARTAAVAGVAASSVLLSVRSPYGLDGADQMTSITFMTILIARLSQFSVNLFQHSIHIDACEVSL